MSKLKGKVVYVLGADGYIGWPLTVRLQKLGAEVVMVDNLAKRRWEQVLDAQPLMPIAEWGERRRGLSAERIDLALEPEVLYELFDRFPPDAVVHLGEQPSAPLSMLSRAWAVRTQHGNVLGTLNLMFALMHVADRDEVPHLVKLGSMGEYGTPGIPIEEGWLDVTHKGFSDRVLFPKRPGSFYHLSKVHDSHNLEFGCRVWGMRVTDLNQGVVWGLESADTPFCDSALRTSFHCDEIFGTVVNRFLAQACAGTALSVYGSGGQRRGFIHLEDSLRCIVTALENPAERGEFRVANQITETLSVQHIAQSVARVCKARIEHLHNPRVESEQHPYEVTHEVLPGLGFTPTQRLDDEAIASMALNLKLCADTAMHRRLNDIAARPQVKWRASA